MRSYTSFKNKRGAYTVATSRYKCDACNSFLDTKTSYEYFKGICPPCRKTTPSHIPEEQIVRWKRSQKTGSI